MAFLFCGAGVFFIPYFVFLFFCGIPVFFLETAMGQYTSQGGVTAWRKMCPMFEGKKTTPNSHRRRHTTTDTKKQLQAMTRTREIYFYTSL